MSSRSVLLALAFALAAAALAGVAYQSGERWRESRASLHARPDPADPAGANPPATTPAERRNGVVQTLPFWLLASRPLGMGSLLSIALVALACARGWFPWALVVFLLPSALVLWTVHLLQQGGGGPGYAQFSYFARVLMGASPVILFIMAVVPRR